MSNDPFVEIRTLQAVAELGSFSAAGERLGVGQSAVSRRIAGLEARLGGRRLVARTTRSMQLTATGKRYLRTAQAALEQLHQAEQQVLGGESELGGLLRLSLPPAVGRQCLLPVLEELMDEHPALKLELDFSERYVDFLEDRIDLALRTRPTPQSGIRDQVVAKVPLLLVGAPGYLARLGRLDSPAALAQCRFVVQRSQTSADLVGRINALGMDVDRSARVRVDDVAAIRQLLLLGHGVSVLPEPLLREDLEVGRLAVVDLPVELPPLTYHASFPSEHVRSARVAAVLVAFERALRPARAEASDALQTR